MIVTAVLTFYFAVCISVVLFNCWKVFSEYLLRQEERYLKDAYWKWFREEAVNAPKMAPEERLRMAKKMARRLQKTRRSLIFQSVLEEAKQTQQKQLLACMPLFAQVVEQMLPYYIKKRQIRQAYYAYLVTDFRVLKYIPSEPIIAFLMQQIKANDSLYNLENALRAIYSSGRVQLVLEALRNLNDDEEIYIHEKMLVDGLLTFEQPDRLIAELWKQMDAFTEEMRVVLLTYIRFASGTWRTRMLALLRSTDELETKISCLRYFAKYPEEKFRPILYELTARTYETEWEIGAVCMSVLASYPGEETVRLLKAGLCSRHWHVRYNAANSLCSLSMGAEHLQDILNGSDRYAKQMLQYRLGIAPEETAKEEELQ